MSLAGGTMKQSDLRHVKIINSTVGCFVPRNEQVESACH